MSETARAYRFSQLTWRLAGHGACARCNEVACSRCTGLVPAEQAVSSIGPNGRRNYCYACAKRVSPRAWAALAARTQDGEATG